jgi:single-strand DNA-binding protein
MASSLNKITLIGNLGRDPEIRTMNDGTKIANFSVATSEKWKDKLDGKDRERTEWHNVVVFNPRLAEIVENYYRKGHRVYVEGQLQSRKFTDDQGVERKIWEVVIRYKGESMIIDSKGSPNAPLSEESIPSMSSRDQDQKLLDQDDDIPF